MTIFSFEAQGLCLLESRVLSSWNPNRDRFILFHSMICIQRLCYLKGEELVGGPQGTQTHPSNKDQQHAKSDRERKIHKKPFKSMGFVGSTLMIALFLYRVNNTTFNYNRKAFITIQVMTLYEPSRGTAACSQNKCKPISSPVKVLPLFLPVFIGRWT